LFDPVRRVLGLAHAGWRGACGGVVLNTVARMVSDFGSSPGDIVAAIGPSIGPCCYEVGSDVAEAAARYRAPVTVSRETDSKFTFDLWQAIQEDLATGGVGQVLRSDICTGCNPDRFYSHRIEGWPTGRMGAVAFIP